MDFMRKIPGVSTPTAPKFRPLALPGDPVPPLSAGWSSSSSSEGSSSPCPSTPSVGSPPYSVRALSRSSASSGYASRPNTPVHTSIASRMMTPDPDLYKSRMRRPSSTQPPVEIQNPTPHRAWVPIPFETPKPRPAGDGQTGKPLKGILKKRPGPPIDVPTVPMHSSTSSASSISPPPSAMRPPHSSSPHALRSTHSVSRNTSRSTNSASPYPAPRGSTPAPLALHWLLLPDTLGVVGKQVVYDFAQDVSSLKIVDVSRGARQKLHTDEVDRYLDKAACQAQQLTEMQIRCDTFPGATITIKASNGKNIRCSDVFDQLYQWLDHKCNLEERDEWVETPEQARECIDAFLARCKVSTRHCERAEWLHGMRRVDLFKGKPWFRGLKRGVPASGKDEPSLFWVVDVGDKPNV
ncbi:uncharacterized protein BXZ73DRAFT_103630 [Epithele typhae]|uniref:uncharacterized protein n=1 Tax=Epithele typhae TaxID=378194 RepID=UPI0020085BA6|nr:uncharacterized protein BXZ73DRAFT_103630 [Epithele typhae]KAH9924341.1 hypothetical protein BXZ73DRAFT_103630 [Epithele typhae]